MAKRAKIISGLLGGLALLVGAWWILVPKVGTTTEAEIRAHVAPELLAPLAHPQGGKERYDALRAALDGLVRDGKSVYAGSDARLRQRWLGHVLNGDVISVATPAGQQFLDILAQGPLDRTATPFSQLIQIVSVSRGLDAGAIAAADAGEWNLVQQQMDAACLLLARLLESDAIVRDRIGSRAIESDALRTILDLASRSDLPAAVAARLSTLAAAEGLGPQDMRRVLRGEFQLNIMRQLLAGQMDDFQSGRPWARAGTLDPIATAELISGSFMEVARNAQLPPSRRSSEVARRILQSKREMDTLFKNPVLSGQPAFRFRFYMNTGANTLGHWLAAQPDTQQLLDLDLELRTRREQAVAALAISRFRKQAGRDPRSFEELVASGLLPAVPMDYAGERQLPFDLKVISDWDSVGRH